MQSLQSPSYVMYLSCILISRNYICTWVLVLNNYNIFIDLSIDMRYYLKFLFL